MSLTVRETIDFARGNPLLVQATIDLGKKTITTGQAELKWVSQAALKQPLVPRGSFVIGPCADKDKLFVAMKDKTGKVVCAIFSDQSFESELVVQSLKERITEYVEYKLIIESGEGASEERLGVLQGLREKISSSVENVREKCLFKNRDLTLEEGLALGGITAGLRFDF